MTHVESVLKVLRQAGLTAKASKCQWRRSKLEYLGHVVGEGHYSIPMGRVEMLKSYAKPVTRKQLRSFLGMIGY